MPPADLSIETVGIGLMSVDRGGGVGIQPLALTIDAAKAASRSRSSSGL